MLIPTCESDKKHVFVEVQLLVELSLPYSALLTVRWAAEMFFVAPYQKEGCEGEVGQGALLGEGGGGI